MDDDEGWLGIGTGLIGTLGWIVMMYFLFFAGDDEDYATPNGNYEEKIKLVVDEEGRPVDDYSYDTCEEELASKHYDNKTIEQLCSIREANK